MSFYKNMNSIRQYHSCSDVHNREYFEQDEIAYWVEGDVMFKRNDIDEAVVGAFVSCRACVFGGEERGKGNFNVKCYGPECMKRFSRYCNYIKL